MVTISEKIDAWLRDAHATEGQAATMLRKTAERNEDYPKFSQMLMRQSEICSRNTTSLEQRLNDRGAGTSLIKDTTGQISAIAQSLSGIVVGDEILKAALATTSFARMQSASARILLIAATQEGDMNTAQICEKIANSSQQFAVEIDEMLPTLTTEYLSRE